MTTLDPGVGRGAWIAGAGMSPVGRRTGSGGIELRATAARAAIADAGLRAADIDGITSMGDRPTGDAAQALRIDAAWRGGGFDTGGLLSPVMSAFVAVATGRARHVLVYRTVQMMGGSILPQPGAAATGAPSQPGEQPGPLPSLDWVGPLLTMHAYSAANWVAMHCRRHMHLYGTTREQLGWLAVNSRRNAARNPAAAYRDPVTLEDYLAARPISDPLGLLDCDVPVDGSLALVVSASGRAGDGPNPPVRAAALGGSSGDGASEQRPDYPTRPAARAPRDMRVRAE